jgi:hypothetical protein
MDINLRKRYYKMKNHLQIIRHEVQQFISNKIFTVYTKESNMEYMIRKPTVIIRRRRNIFGTNANNSD